MIGNQAINACAMYVRWIKKNWVKLFSKCTLCETWVGWNIIWVKCSIGWNVNWVKRNWVKHFGETWLGETWLGELLPHHLGSGFSLMVWAQSYPGSGASWWPPWLHVGTWPGPSGERLLGPMLWAALHLEYLNSIQVILYLGLQS